jgi:hypothetical protein
MVVIANHKPIRVIITSVLGLDELEENFQEIC